ncbi:MAG TPA: Gfo/Idh/MocA family oxidoreductase [Verrucomicrobiae bacterium]|nr:Gfo/Idh/MocA family oxidoreductase [Verrucomicrobiae bacterium]
MKTKIQSRRAFFKKTLVGSFGLAVLPDFIPSKLLGADAPSKKIQIAQIGCGRMGRSDLGNVLKEPLARVVAVCDLDAKRLAAGKKFVEDYYYSQRGESGAQIKTFHDYRDILASPKVDAVVVTTPDHWHAQIAIEAAIAGKHIYVQKPVTYSIAEAIGLRRAVETGKIILQTGSQQRSERPWKSFRAASEAVRNGRIGQLRTIKIGVGLDKASGHAPAPMPVPPNLDFETWLGPAPEQPYMEGRVHPQNELDGRPGWMTTEDFGLGMITNWGAHHVDIAQWAMGQELGGPHTIEAHAKFPQNDLVTVHTTYHVEMTYPQNVRVILDDKFENGIRFEGDDGWVFCSRDSREVDDATALNGVRVFPSLRASDKKILSPLGENAVRWPPSKSHHGNWLESIVANRQPIAPIQQSARSLETCAAAWIGMKLKRKLYWDAATEKFVNDNAANVLRSRPARKPEFDFERVLKSADIA